MGTNFYARNRYTIGEGLHIGKRSAGWDFLFRAYPDGGLTDCAAWHTYLSQPGVRIVDECGAEHALSAFWRRATARPGDAVWVVEREHAEEWRTRRDNPRVSAEQWVDEHGHPFAAYEFC